MVFPIGGKRRNRNFLNLSVQIESRNFDKSLNDSIFTTANEISRYSTDRTPASITDTSRYDWRNQVSQSINLAYFQYNKSPLEALKDRNHRRNVQRDRFVANSVDKLDPSAFVIKNMNQHKIMLQTKNTGKFSQSPFFHETFHHSRFKAEKTNRALRDAEEKLQS